MHVLDLERMGTDQSPKADNNEDEHPPRGQNRNRRPAPAQRNGNGEEELTDKQKVLMDLAEMGYALNQFGNYQRTDESTGTPLQAPEDVLITRIYDHRQKFGKRPISKERIKDILVENAQTHWENLYVKKVREVEFTSGTPNKVEDLCRAIAGPNFHPLYPVVLNHIAWSIKRRMRQMPVDYPILINFSGPEECGKSFLVRRMCEAVLPIRQFEELKDSGAILSNMERSGYLFTDRLVVVLGELTNMERVSIDVLKDLIDAEEIAYRRFFTQRSANGPNRAQLIGTSNRHLREIFPRDEFIRKYCNVCFDDCPREERVNVRWKIVDDFNFSEWFRSINESGPSPLAPVYPKFREWVKTDCYRPTETEVWLSGYISLHPGDERQFAAIWDDYQKNPHLPKAKLGRDNFQRLLVRQGCERKTVSGRSHYILPAITTPLDGWDAYFPQTIDDIKARVFGKGKPD